MGGPAGTTFERTIDTAERDMAMARRKALGYSYREVAEHFEVSAATAHRAVQRALVATAAIGGEEARTAELVKLDAMESAVLGVLSRAHVTVSQGRLILDAEGHALPDDAPILAAVAQWLRIAERRSKLMGLDAPARQIVTVITEDVVDAEIRRLQEELARLDDSAPASTA